MSRDEGVSRKWHAHQRSATSNYHPTSYIITSTPHFYAVRGAPPTQNMI